MPVLQHNVLCAFSDSAHFLLPYQEIKYLYQSFLLLRSVLTNELGSL